MLESYRIIYGLASAFSSLVAYCTNIANTDRDRYVPSLVLSIISIALFAIGFAGHVFLLSKYRTWYFVPIALGTVLEIIGYIFRILSNVDNPYAVAYFVAQYFCIVVAPVFSSASIYSITSVLTNFYGRQSAPLSPKLILWGL
ncbi:hypothetical protein E4T52_15122 [Aureobasidium sp. EXF-3400]|nr:hypothetical protein E4T51_14141 [Aureobasidium sp. EXF-12344]KAI4769830.1 hypothetical protein E4T52_15122 [Aureobasidium sp. EXF-3400]